MDNKQAQEEKNNSQYQTLKIRYVEQQISNIIGSSELPIGLLYYMMKSLTSDLGLMLNQQIQAERNLLEKSEEDAPTQTVEVK